MNLKSIKGIFTISGTIVGAGILALPLAMAQLGFVPGFFVLAVVGLAFIYTAYYIGEAAINSEEEISLSGLAKKHFGAIGLGVMLFGVLVYIYGALIGYLSAGGKVINDLSNGLISQSWGTVIYFIFGAFIVYMGLRFVESSEFVLFGLVLLLFFILNLITVSHVRAPLLFASDISKFFAVFGVVFFAYNGHSIIPSIARQFKNNIPGFKKVAFFGVFIPFCLYVLWCFTVIGSVPLYGTGSGVTALTSSSLQDAKDFGQPATIPLGHLFGGAIILTGFAFSLFATLTSFIGFGFSLSENFIDFFRKKIPWIVAIALSLVPPLFFSFFNKDVFLSALDVAGTYGAGVFAGIMPCLIILKVRREKAGRPLNMGEKIGPYSILALFSSVLLYTTFSFFLG